MGGWGRYLADWIDLTWRQLACLKERKSSAYWLIVKSEAALMYLKDWQDDSFEVVFALAASASEKTEYIKR